MNVFSNLPFTPEYVTTVLPDIENIFEYTFSNSYEGAIIRVFYFKDKWFYSTHRKLDAFKSRWSSKETFGDTFLKSIMNHPDVNYESKEEALEYFETH